MVATTGPSENSVVVSINRDTTDMAIEHIDTFAVIAEIIIKGRALGVVRIPRGMYEAYLAHDTVYIWRSHVLKLYPQ